MTAGPRGPTAGPEAAREKFKRALDRLLAAHGDWARYRWSATEAERERLAEVAEAAERTVLQLYDAAAAQRALEAQS